jgi:hypothetical protein
MAQARGIVAAGWLALAMCRAQEAPIPPLALPADAPATTFGVTVVDSVGLEGKIYFIKAGSDELPNFKKLKPVGSVYTTSLNITPRHFIEGFPGLTDRFEWFAIDYSGKFWIEEAATYLFGLLSDDGSKLYIDGREVIDNDGIHPAITQLGKAKLSRGPHRIRVSYFQGPRDSLALVLAVARPGEHWRIFNTKDFLPANPADWKEPGTDASGHPGTPGK